MKKFIFATVVLCIVATFVECASQLTHRYMYERYYDPGKIHKLALDSVYRPNITETIDYLSHQIIHPYLGFVGGNNREAEAAHGFYKSFPQDVSQQEDVIRVLLTGGSVAMQVSSVLEQVLGDRVSSELGYEKPVRVFTAALGGFKQPQQLLALNYLTLMGFQFDLVINLDGYNEIVLPWSENVQFGVHPFFPRRWEYRMSSVKNRDELAAFGEIEMLRRRKQSILDWANANFMGRSALVGLALSQYFISADLRINQLTNQAGQENADLPFEASGPDFGEADIDSTLSASASFWKESSTLMNRFSQGLGVPYLHVLQPNQYVENSKPFSQRELDEFIVDGFLSQVAARRGYPLLIESGGELVRDGVAFRDATEIFLNERRTVYSDACCHLNQLGKEILAGFVAAEALPLILRQ